MEYGICHLSVIPVYNDREEPLSMISQLIYGEHYKVLETKKKWCKIRMAFDEQEGWINRTQYSPISKPEFNTVENSNSRTFSGDLIAGVNLGNDCMQAIPFGSVTSNMDLMGHAYEGENFPVKPDKSKLIAASLFFLHAPEMTGGRTPLGIDSPGLVQMIYRLHNVKLPRSAADQALHGTALSFIEESETGDLAFFDDREGVINHVGIILPDHRILHVFGAARIDRLDHTGIFNAEEKKYSHPLRVIRKLL